jgi:RNA polymerase sigma factor FliA
MQNAPSVSMTPAAPPFPFSGEMTTGFGRPALDRDALVESHFQQVWHVARSLARRLPPSVDIEDLVGAGALGLMAAADRYQPERGITFKTYAETRIRGAMLDYLRDLDWAPRRLRRAQRTMRDVAVRIGGDGAATDEQMAGALGLELGEYQGLRQSLRGLSVMSYDEAAGDAASLPVASDSEKSPLAEYERVERRERLAAAIEMLSERERQVISLSFVDELSLREIGVVFGVTESRVSQIRTQALRTLRALLEG